MAQPNYQNARQPNGVRRCPYCGAALPPGGNFCINCGNAVAGGGRAQKGNNTALLIVVIVAVVLSVLIGIGLLIWGLPSRSSGSRGSLGHTHTWQAATCTSAAVCTGCGETNGSALGHRWAEATADAPKTCTVCGLTQGEALILPVYLNELPYSAKYGKLWTRSEKPLDVYSHSNGDHPRCWEDMNMPGHTQGPVRDIWGNSYTYGLHLDGAETADYYITYNLGGKYTTFTGVCAYPENVISVQWAPHYSKQFKVFGDGKPLYTSALMNKSTAAAPFRIDVTGVYELRIEYSATDGPNEVATLFDGRVE